MAELLTGSYLETSTPGLTDNVTVFDSSSTDDCNPYDSTIRSRLRFWLLAVILPLGLLFNTTALIVFLVSTRLRQNTSTHFLIALTCADTAYLIGELLKWLCSWDAEWKYIFGMDFTNRFNFWCRTMYFLRYLGQFASSWLTVALTTERCLCIWSPLRIGELSTKPRIRVIIICIFIISILLNIYPYWTLQSIHIDSTNGDGFYTCTFVQPQSKHYDPWFWATFRIGSLVIPSILVFILTSLILVKFSHVSKERRRMQLATNSNGSSAGNLHNQVGAMLMLVAVTFLILRLPFCIMSFVHDLTQGVRFGCNLSMDLMYEITSCLAVINYGINLFLYCLSGSIFRESFVSVVLCKITLAQGGRHNDNAYSHIAGTSVYRLSAKTSREQSMS